VVNGYSNNTLLKTRDPNWAVLGYKPRDNAHDHRDLLRRKGIDVDGPDRGTAVLTLARLSGPPARAERRVRRGNSTRPRRRCVPLQEEASMSGSNSFKFVMLPPQSSTTRDWAKRLADMVPETRVVVAEDADTAAREIVDAEAAFGWLGGDLLSKATRLRWLQAPQAAPPAGYYYPELIAHSVEVTNFREIFNDHIGAHILAFVLAFARGLHVFIPQQLRREWKKSPAESGDVVHLPEATALIVGVGGIGSEAARLLSAFGVTVLGTDARRTAAPEGVAELHRPEALDALLPRANFVILTVPHTPATEGFFDRARFRRMKPTAFFINIGRGMTTKLDDLVKALEAGEIAGAALDVYEQEPLPPDHPLWTLPNVLLTPHIAGHGPYLNDRRFQIMVDNCRAFAAGRALRNVVDKSSWF
jgi:phosphoglycerate dehydrogenase-like enzyme